jgi:hypothetical protein
MNATLVKAAIAFVFRIVAVRRHGDQVRSAQNVLT